MMRQLSSVAAVAAAMAITGVATGGTPGKVGDRSADRGHMRTTVVKALNDGSAHKTLARGWGGGFGRGWGGGWGRGWGGGWGRGWGGGWGRGWGGGWGRGGWGWSTPVFVSSPVVISPPGVSVCSSSPAFFTSPAIGGVYSSGGIATSSSRTDSLLTAPSGARTIPPALLTPGPDTGPIPTVPVGPNIPKIGKNAAEKLVSLPRTWKQFEYSPTGGMLAEAKPAPRPAIEVLVNNR